MKSQNRHEYRHVMLPRAIAKDMYRLTGGQRLLSEEEWRGLGVQQSRGWMHYEIHRPEPHILLMYVFLFKLFSGFYILKTNV